MARKGLQTSACGTSVQQTAGESHSAMVDVFNLKLMSAKDSSFMRDTIHGHNPALNQKRIRNTDVTRVARVK
jgi:hypothetical protein